MKDFIPLNISKLDRVVSLDGSKSISNRVLIVAAMSEGNTQFYNVPNSADVLACVQALRDLGYDIEHDQESKKLKITGCDAEFVNKKAKIFCNESGTLTRFIIPMCAIQASGEYHIYAKPRMMERPITDLLKPLTELGMSAEFHNKKNSLPMTIHANGLVGSSIAVDGKKSSQFASGLLMSGVFMDEGLCLNSLSDHKQPYLEMTAKVMKEFSVDVNIENNIYKVSKSKYISPGEYVIEPDASTASYFWAYAAITGNTVKVMNITKNSKQGDIKFLEVLEDMGCVVNYYDDGIEVKGRKYIKGVKVNMRNFSDTFMTLAAIACFADSDTHIDGLSHTRGQESDRVSAMEEGLKKLGIYVKTTKDSMMISPSRSNLRAAEVDSYNDHRIAMSLALLGLRKEGVIINDAQAVSKTCPDYFDRMRALVGTC